MPLPDAEARSVTPAGRLRDTAAARGDDVALRWQDRTVTWAELDARVDTGTAVLADLGVAAGDRVAIVLGNVPAFVEAWFATLRLGAVAVPVAPALAPDELRFVLADAGVVVAVVSPRVAEGLAPLRDALPGLRTVVAAGASTSSSSSLLLLDHLRHTRHTRHLRHRHGRRRRALAGAARGCGVRGCGVR